jgi:hypothetical protein
MVPTSAIRDLQDKVASLLSRVSLIEAMLAVKETRQPPDLCPETSAVSIMTHEVPKSRRKRRTRAEIEADIAAALDGYQDKNAQEESEDTGDTEDADQR